MPGIDSDNGYSLFVPAKTDPAVVAKRNAAARKAMATAAINEGWRRLVPGQSLRLRRNRAICSRHRLEFAREALCPADPAPDVHAYWLITRPGSAPEAK